jgi:hypothetical protein
MADALTRMDAIWTGRRGPGTVIEETTMMQGMEQNMMAAIAILVELRRMNDRAGR